MEVPSGAMSCVSWRSGKCCKAVQICHRTSANEEQTQKTLDLTGKEQRDEKGKDLRW